MNSLPRWKLLRAALVVCRLALPSPAIAEGTWIPVNTHPPEGIETMLLLPDGTVMAQGGGSVDWYKLKPDLTGGYTNGAWTARTSMNYTRLYYSSDVLQDGRVFVAGAEYGTGTTNAEIYDPVSDHWNVVSIPGGIINENNTVSTNDNSNSGGFIDSASILLASGNVLITPVSPATNTETVTYDPANNVWNKAYLQNNGNEDEAGLLKLPDDSVLVIDSYSETSERYIPSSNQWIDDGDLPENLYSVPGGELGAGFLLPNGNGFFIGSMPDSAIYKPSGNTNPGSWSPGATIPNGLAAPDAPAAMMNNGKILCVLSPNPYRLTGTNYVFTTPTYYYEYDYSVGSKGAFTQIHAPNGSFTNAGPTFHGRMLVLPDGTILYTDGTTNLYVYQPDGSPLASGKPAIASVTWNSDGSLHLSGTLFNGISQGAAYGDDAQMDSNYPLVRFIDGGGNVYYGRTYNWSTSGVQTGGKVVTTEVKLPSGVLSEPGAYSVQVVANGIASDPVSFYGPVWVDFNYTGALELGTYSQPYKTLAKGVSAVASGGTISIKGNGKSAETPTISKAMHIISVGGPATVGQ